ncbi:SDR family NAD(P)-dependent oxidoreductase [Pseudahrensia aquimaris]|uniref:SDR family NAD(P)-dependent oxidoreductase n=1 Tax=Pseudahrensia aquimaris TaxID=744461 RepID=A0ABW3FFV8_9HYPH
MSDQSLEERLAVVTGASRGVGYHAALGLAQAGAHVIAVARTQGGLEELDDEIKQAGGSATLVPLDLRDFDALDRLGGSIHERWGKLDIVLGNAGMLGTPTPLPHMTPKAFDDVMAVNVTANFRLIRSLDPLLRLSDAGRALFVTSGASRSTRPFVGPYAASKAALEAMVISYARENEKTAMKINLVDPGTLRTKMRAQYAPGEDPETVTPPEAIVPTLVDLLSPSCEETGRIFSFPDQAWM